MIRSTGERRPTHSRNNYTEVLDPNPIVRTYDPATVFGDSEVRSLLVFVVPLLMLVLVAPTVAHGGTTERGEVVSGVLESVNAESNTVQIRNALDQPIFLKITKPHLLEGITPGERVTVVVNEQHEIIKLIETPIPELPSPASP